MSTSIVQNFGSALVAAGTTAATGLAIGSKYSHFATCTSAAYACYLPNIPECSPSFFHICNHGAANLQVFPSNATTTQGTIDGRAAGASFFIAPGASALFVATTVGTAAV